MSVTPAWFRLDMNRLEEEWVRQAERMYELCMDLADAQKALTEAENSLELVKGELDKEVRLHPATYGIDKLTEPRVKAAIVAHKSHLTAERTVVEAAYDVARLKAGVTALEHKKRALEALVDLYGMGYFAQPHAPTPEGRRAIEARTKDAALTPRGVGRR